MKKQSLYSLSAVAATSLLLASCNIWKDVEYTVTPDPLEMHGDSVAVNISVKIPKKGIHKKAVAEVTPMLGDNAFKTVIVQGPKAPGNGQVIEKEGGTVTYSDVIPYNDNMENSELKIKAFVKKGKKEETFETDKVADATIITPYLLQNDDKALIGSDNFQRVTEEKQYAEINYLKGRHNVRSSELKDEDIKEMNAFVVGADTNQKIALKRVDIQSYASPEGEIDINENLANDRAKTGQETMVDIFKKNEVEQGQDDGFYKKDPRGEDWDGFKKAVEASDMEDKELILRVLEQYPDKRKREEEIRNMAKTYRRLEKDILPPLRRSQINLVYDLTGYSDEELMDLCKNDPDTLTVEELLFSATLFEDLNEKKRIYQEVERLYPEDWRGYNNVGYVLYMENNLDAAKAKFEKANEMNENAVSKNNLGIIARIKGDREKARELFKEASSAGPEVKYNMGLINVQDGNYDEALSNFGSEKTFNVALTQVVNGDAEAGKGTIEASDDLETAMGQYLMAIIGSRTDDKDLMISSLKNATSKDSSLKAKAAKDREFIKYFEDADFKAVVQ